VELAAGMPDRVSHRYRPPGAASIIAQIVDPVKDRASDQQSSALLAPINMILT
jgi:hypothetical protein